MKGKYHLVLRDNKICFDLVLERNITVIKGKSATGKSTLYSYFEEVIKGKTAGIHCNLKDKLVLFDNLYDWKRNFELYKNKIFIADEWFTEVIQTQEFASYLNNSDNYFILISRSGRFKYLSYSTKCIYEIVSEKRENITYNSLHERYIDDNSIVCPDLVITEDNCSGYQMFSNILNCKVVSAKGKDKIDKCIEANLGKYKSICAIVDGAAFGSLIELVCRKYISMNNVCILAPESFEFLLLNSNPFLRVAKGEILETYDYCDSVNYLSWERYYTDLIKKLCLKFYSEGYSKSNLSKVFRNGKYLDVIKNQLSIDSSIYKFPSEVFLKKEG